MVILLHIFHFIMRGSPLIILNILNIIINRCYVASDGTIYPCALLAGKKDWNIGSVYNGIDHYSIDIKPACIRKYATLF